MHCLLYAVSIKSWVCVYRVAASRADMVEVCRDSKDQSRGFWGVNYSSLLSMSVIETSLYSSLSSMVSLLVMPCLSIFD